MDTIQWGHTITKGSQIVAGQEETDEGDSERVEESLEHFDAGKGALTSPKQ